MFADFLKRKIFLAIPLSLAALFVFAAPAAAQSSESNGDAEANQTKAIAIFENAQNAHEKNDLPGAVKLYDEALKLFPEFPEAEYQRAAALLSLGKTSEAEKGLRRAAELRPDWSLALASLGSLLVRSDKLAEAEKFLTEAIKLDRKNFPAAIALAELRLRTESSPASLKDLLFTLRNLTDGKSNAPASAWAWRGAIERRLEDFPAAKTSLNQALAVDANNVTALVERAQLFAAAGDLESAKIDAENAVKLSTEDWRWKAQVLLARLQAEAGNAAEAQKTLDRIAERAKNFPQVIALRTALAANRATGAEGIAELEKILEKDGKNAAALNRLCVLSRTVDPQKALNYCRRASELEPQNVSHAIGYGAALVQDNQFAPAVELFQKLLKIVPENYTVRANLATALYKLKRYDEAVAEFNRLLEMKPDTPVAYFFIATAYDAQNKYVDAMAAYQKFLQLADAGQNQLEIDKVKLRLPALARQVDRGAGKKKN